MAAANPAIPAPTTMMSSTIFAIKNLQEKENGMKEGNNFKRDRYSFGKRFILGK
jgi:hypothetical protein